MNTYVKDALGLSIVLDWRDATGTVRDFSDGYTARVELALSTARAVTLLQITTVDLSGVYGAYVINPAVGAFNSLAAGTYVLWCYVTPTSGADEVFNPGQPPTMVLLDAPTPV